MTVGSRNSPAKGYEKRTFSYEYFANTGHCVCKLSDVFFVFDVYLREAKNRKTLE